jgi:hypothetical protein
VKRKPLRPGDIFRHSSDAGESYWLVVPYDRKLYPGCAAKKDCRAIRLPGGHTVTDRGYLGVGAQSWWTVDSKKKRTTPAAYGRAAAGDAQ